MKKSHGAQAAVGRGDDDVAAVLDTSRRARGRRRGAGPAGGGRSRRRRAAAWSRAAEAREQRAGEQEGGADPLGERRGRRASCARRPRSARRCCASRPLDASRRGPRAARAAPRCRGSAARCAAMTSSSVSRAQASSGSAAFLLPAGTTVPDSGTPPSMTNFSMRGGGRTGVGYRVPWYQPCPNDRATSLVPVLRVDGVRESCAGTCWRSRPHARVRARSSARTRSAGAWSGCCTTSTTSAIRTSRRATRGYALAELERLRLPGGLVRAVASHADYLGVSRDTPMEKTLLRGRRALRASSWPARTCARSGIDGLTPKSVKKKMKTPAFAAAVNREDAARGRRACSASTSTSTSRSSSRRSRRTRTSSASPASASPCPATPRRPRAAAGGATRVPALEARRPPPAAAAALAHSEMSSGRRRRRRSGARHGAATRNTAGVVERARRTGAATRRRGLGSASRSRPASRARPGIAQRHRRARAAERRPRARPAGSASRGTRRRDSTAHVRTSSHVEPLIDRQATPPVCRRRGGYGVRRPWCGIPRQIIVLEGDETGQELLEQAIRVLDPGLSSASTLELVHYDLSLEKRRETDNEVVHEAARGDARGRLRHQGRDDHARGQGRRRLPEPHPPRGGRRQGHRPHRAAASRASRPSPASTHPISVVRMAVDDAYGAKQWREGGRAATTRSPSGRRRSRARPAAPSPSTRSGRPSGCGGKVYGGPEVDGLPRLRGDAQGGDGRRGRPATPTSCTSPC